MTLEPTLARGMRQLNGVYAQWFNRRHRRVGHLFQGRYKAVVVQTDAHLRRTVRYLIRNPIDIADALLRRVREVCGERRDDATARVVFCPGDAEI